MRKSAVVGAATVTATALTVGMAPPPDPDRSVSRDVALAASPNYTQIIENSSDTLNNLLYTQANLTRAFGAALNPLAALTGGLLPSVDADVDQVEVDSLASLVQTLALVLGALGTVPDLGSIPGLPPNAATDLADALALPGDLGLGTLAPLLLETVGVFATVDSLLDVVGNLPLVSVPSLDDVIDALGLTIETTSFTSSLMWPVLGVNGAANVTNIFAQLDGLTGAALIGEILAQTTLLGQPLPPALVQTVSGILSPLDVLETPSVTAWLPTTTGNYTLPLGGSMGWLGTMPTVALGPIDLLGVQVPETVVALPLAAGGVTLPLGLASFGAVGTPGAVLPTATGVSTLLGTNLQSFAVPLLGLSYTSLNTLNSTYVGTNGFNYNSGQTVGLLTTPFGVLPIVYSLGKVNAGTTGFGFTGPSLFGVGLLPHLQVGAAPEQESPDGVLPPEVLNLGLALPTQVTSVVELLGLPSPQGAIDAVVNPVFDATAAPLGALITAFLNDNIGSFADGSSEMTLRLTNLIREISERLPAARQMPADDEEATDANLLAAETADGQSQGVAVTADGGIQSDPASQPLDTAKAPGEPQAAVELDDTATNARIADAEQDALKQTDETFTNAQKRLDTIAANGRKQIDDTVKDVRKGIRDTAKHVGTELKKALSGGKKDEKKKDDAEQKDADKKDAEKKKAEDKGAEPAKSEKSDKPAA